MKEERGQWWGIFFLLLECCCVRWRLHTILVFCHHEGKTSRVTECHTQHCDLHDPRPNRGSLPLRCVTCEVFAAAAKSPQSCPTLCDPIDGSSLGSPVPGILQARTLEWVAISFFNAWKWKVKGKSLSRIWLLATPWTAAHQAPPSMGFSRQEYWSGVPLPSPNFLPKLLQNKRPNP